MNFLSPEGSKNERLFLKLSKQLYYALRYNFTLAIGFVSLTLLSEFEFCLSLARWF